MLATGRASRHTTGADVTSVYGANRPPRAHRGAVLVTLGVLAPLAAAYLWCALALRPAYGLSGDEPHYLAITQGLWLYHTIDQHNVLYHHDFFAYYPHLMSSHSVHRGTHLYPLHYLGLPIVLLPGFVLAGAQGAQVTLIVIALLVLWCALRLCARVAGLIPAAMTVGVLGLSAPFVLGAGAIYPDLASGLVLLLAYEAIDAPRLTVRRALALGLVLAAAPWLHVKLLAIVGVYMAWAAYLLWRQSRQPSAISRQLSAISYQPPTASPRHVTPTSHHAQLTTHNSQLTTVLALGLPVLSLIGLMVFNLIYYGSPNPAAPYQESTLFSGNFLSALAGQLFAQGQGALGTAPFALLAVPGAVALWRRDRATALKIGLVTVPFWLLTLTYRNWWGGDSPPLRFLLTLLPLWATGIAALLAGLRTVAARLAVGLLAALTLALSLVIPVAPRLAWPLPGGQGALLLALGERLRLPLTAWLPLFTPARSGAGAWHQALLIVPWGIALLALWAILAYWEQKRLVASAKSGAFV